MTNIPFYMVNFSFINQHYYFPKLNLENSFNFKVKWNHHLNELSVRLVIGTILRYDLYLRTDKCMAVSLLHDFVPNISYPVFRLKYFEPQNLSPSVKWRQNSDEARIKLNMIMWKRPTKIFLVNLNDPSVFWNPKWTQLELSFLKKSFIIFHVLFYAKSCIFVL